MAGATAPYIEIFAIGHFMIMIIGIIPFIMNFRYFRKTGIVDYLYLAIYFFGLSILLGFIFWALGFDAFGIVWVGTYGSNPKIVDWIFYNVILLFLVNIDALPLVLVALRAKYGSNYSDIPTKILGFLGLIIFLNLMTVFDQEQTMTTQGVFATNLTFWATWITRIIFYGMVGYIFYTTEFNQNQRTNRSRHLWIYSSICMIISMFWFMIPTGFQGYPQDGTKPIVEIFAIGFATFAQILLLINHILHPESVIITKEQIHTAIKMYDKIRLSGNKVSDLGVSHIKSYLDSIPEEFKTTAGE